MNILLEFSTLQYKNWHHMAKELKAFYPGCRFAGLVNALPQSTEIVNFLKGQKDINYQFIHFLDDIRHKAFHAATEPDMELLKSFEENSRYKSLWRFVAADRNLGAVFMHGAVVRDTLANQEQDPQRILGYFSNLLKEYKGVFESFRPDIFMPAIAMGAIDAHILEQLCQQSNTVYLAAYPCRIDDYFTFAESSELEFSLIDCRYRQLLESTEEPQLTVAKRFYEKIISELPAPKYFDRDNECHRITRFLSVRERVVFWLKYIYTPLKVLKNWLKTRSLRRSPCYAKQPGTFKAFLSNLKYEWTRRAQEYRFLCKGAGEPLNRGQKYLYYPLHINPEYSTQFLGTMWLDQITVIEALAKSIPADWLVYVKEHPATLQNRVRPVGFYEKIKRLPNVKLINTFSDMHALVSNAQMVAVITGTSGWEAVQRGVPTINFGKCFWDVLKLSKRCTDLENLSLDIHDEIRRSSRIGDAERKRRLICYLAAVKECGFTISDVQVFGNGAAGSEEQHQRVGRELAGAVHQYCLRRANTVQEDKEYEKVRS